MVLWARFQAIDTATELTTGPRLGGSPGRAVGTEHGAQPAARRDAGNDGPPPRRGAGGARGWLVGDRRAGVVRSVVLSAVGDAVRLVVRPVVVRPVVVRPVARAVVVKACVGVGGAAEAVDDVVDDVLVPHAGAGGAGEGEHDLGLDRPGGGVEAGGAEPAGDEAGEGDDAVVGVLGGFFGEVEPAQVGGAGGRGAERDPASGDRGVAAGGGPAGVEVFGGLLDAGAQCPEGEAGRGGQDALEHGAGLGGVELGEGAGEDPGLVFLQPPVGHRVAEGGEPLEDLAGGRRGGGGGWLP